jgi:TM2 domain-containing membrane protein YozV
MTETKYCANCGAEIDEKAVICTQCGVAQRSEKTETQKNEGLAAVMSFFFAGLGQIYNGQIGKGVILIVIQVINFMLMFILIGLLTYPIVWIYGIWDAYTTAKKINEGTVV